MEYFSSFEQVCWLCKRQRVHSFDDKTEHDTCICMLLSYSSVCCYFGFVNLLRREPDLICFIQKTPFCNNLTRMLYISYHKPLIDTSEEELGKKCREFMINMKDNE